MCLDYDGNLRDACVIALLAALKNSMCWGNNSCLFNFSTAVYYWNVVPEDNFQQFSRSSAPRGYYQHRDPLTDGEFRKEAWTEYMQASSWLFLLCLWWVSELGAPFTASRIDPVCNPGLLPLQVHTDRGPHRWGGETVYCSDHRGDWRRSIVCRTQTRSENRCTLI